MDNKTIKELTANKSSIDNTLKYVPLEEKAATKQFLEALQKIQPNKYYVLSTKDGRTTVMTGEQIQQLPKKKFDGIEGFAASNETSTYSGRRKSASIFDMASTSNSSTVSTTTTGLNDNEVK